MVASLPCYLEDNVRQQRGLGAYSASVEGLLALNAAGYGKDERLLLHLVYNPVGPHLPPSAEQLDGDYHRELQDRFGIVFNELWTITNMPIQRWRDDLVRKDQLNSYMKLLAVDSQGAIHDCDFNYALKMTSPDVPGRLWERSIHELASRRIATAEHCLGCTAGRGSSCGGSLV